MIYNILDDNGNVINTILAEAPFVEAHYPGHYALVGPEPAPPAPPPIITKIAMLTRLTDAEYVGILTAAKTDVSVEAWKTKFDAANLTKCRGRAYYPSDRVVQFGGRIARTAKLRPANLDLLAVDIDNRNEIILRAPLLIRHRFVQVMLRRQVVAFRHTLVQRRGGTLGASERVEISLGLPAADVHDNVGVDLAHLRFLTGPDGRFRFRGPRSPRRSA